jgi:hypothetical protein
MVYSLSFLYQVIFSFLIPIGIQNFDDWNNYLRLLDVILRDLVTNLEASFSQASLYSESKQRRFGHLHNSASYFDPKQRRFGHLHNSAF